MSKVGCVIIEDFKRPDKALVEKFRNVAVANLDDCMNRISAVHEDIRPVNKGKLLGHVSCSHGPGQTWRCDCH